MKLRLMTNLIIVTFERADCWVKRLMKNHMASRFESAFRRTKRMEFTAGRCCAELYRCATPSLRLSILASILLVYVSCWVLTCICFSSSLLLFSLRGVVHDTSSQGLLVNSSQRLPAVDPTSM